MNIFANHGNDTFETGEASHRQERNGVALAGFAQEFLTH